MKYSATWIYMNTCCYLILEMTTVEMTNDAIVPVSHWYCVISSMFSFDSIFQIFAGLCLPNGYKWRHKADQGDFYLHGCLPCFDFSIISFKFTFGISDCNNAAVCPGGVWERDSEAQRCSEGDGRGGLCLQRTHPTAAVHYADSLCHCQRSVTGFSILTLSQSHRLLFSHHGQSHRCL